MNNYEIILEQPITIDNVYKELSGKGEFNKIFNKTVNAEFRWFPNNLIEIINVKDGICEETLRELMSFEEFCKIFPTDNWFIGYFKNI